MPKKTVTVRKAGAHTKAENRQQLYIRTADLPIWAKFKRQCARAKMPLNQVLMTWARKSVGEAA